MAALLRREPGLDAVFAASDLIAAGALQSLREGGRTVPDDVAVVGFDDLPLASHLQPPLTTVLQPIEEMGRQMTRMLLARIREEPVTEPHLVLCTKMVLRTSA